MRVAVIGLGQFGRKLASTLFEKSIEVIGIDRNPGLINELKDVVTRAVNLDVRDEKALKSVGINDCDIAVVAIGVNFEMSVLATAVLKNIDVPMIISRATTDLQAQILYKVGAHKVINIEAAMGVNVAKSLVQDQIKEHIPLASGHSLIEVEVPVSKTGKTLLELDVRKNFGINIVAVESSVVTMDEKGNEIKSLQMNDLPGPDTVLFEGDIVCIVGQDEKIEAFINS